MEERGLASDKHADNSQLENAEKLYEEAKPSVATVVASHFYRDKQVMGSAGSGFFVRDASDNGLPRCEMVTDNHVISLDPRLKVKVNVELDDGSVHNATVIKHDPAHDLAFLRVENVADPEKTCKALPLSEDEAKPDELTVRLSRSHLDGPEFHSGRQVNAVKRSDLTLPDLAGDDLDRTMIMFDTYNTIGRQFSGGPYLNKDGEVVAIHEAGQGTHESVATPASDIASQLKELRLENK